MSDIDYTPRFHRASRPPVTTRRAGLHHATMLVREHFGAFVRGTRGRARGLVVHQIARSLGTTYRHARIIVDRMRKNGLLVFDAKRRGYRVA